MHLTGENGIQNYKQQIDSFVCSVMPGTSYKQVYITPGQNRFSFSVNCHIEIIISIRIRKVFYASGVPYFTHSNSQLKLRCYNETINFHSLLCSN